MPSPASPSRRDILAATLAALLAGRPRAALAQQAEGSGEALPFSFDALAEEMRDLAARPWQAPPTPPEGAWWGGLDYDGYRMIRFREPRARLADEGPWRLGAFHLGWLFPVPVRLFEVGGGLAREVLFSTDDFDYFGDLRGRVPRHEGLPGVAGFRLNWPLNRPDHWDEVVSFVGASYFRALGQGNVYGASARGLAIDTWLDGPEEFPAFTRFYVERDLTTATVYAALEGPSVAGAYRFVVRPGPVTEMDVSARLFFRHAVRELGVAPLTSMFLFSGQNRGAFDDFRPAVHDSDGLGLRGGDGVPIWRPLANPPRVATSYFHAVAPRAFGLYQRERDFDDLQDLGARYDLRPSVEVVPEGDWGPGHVRLVEIPSDLEANDNIVAFWVPEAPVAAGDARDFAYRLRWGALAPRLDGPLAVAVATRAGAAGVAGVAALEGARKFAVDFAGGALPAADAPERPLPVATATGGELLSVTLDPLPEAAALPGAWRAVIDVAAPPGAVVELTLHLAAPAAPDAASERAEAATGDGGGTPAAGARLSETWAYQWVNA